MLFVDQDRGFSQARIKVEHLESTETEWLYNEIFVLEQLRTEHLIDSHGRHQDSVMGSSEHCNIRRRVKCQFVHVVVDSAGGQALRIIAASGLSFGSDHASRAAAAPCCAARA